MYIEGVVLMLHYYCGQCTSDGGRHIHIGLSPCNLQSTSKWCFKSLGVAKLLWKALLYRLPVQPTNSNYTPCKFPGR